MKDRFSAVIAAICLSFALPLLAVAQDLERTKAESRLGQVLAEIDRLKTKLESSRTEQRKEQARLREDCCWD